MKKMLCGILSVALAATSLAACSSNEATPAPSTTATTALTDTEPTRVLESTVEVSDVYTDELTIESGTCHYHVPQIHVAGEPLTAVNEAMYATLYDGVMQNQVYAVEGAPAWTGINYIWGENDAVVSVLVGMEDALNTNNYTYIAYSAHKDSGEVIADSSELLSFYGMTEEQFTEAVKSAVEMHFVMTYQSMIGTVGEDQYLQNLQTTLSDETIANATAFISPDGDLCVVADIASFAGADFYKEIINVTGATLIERPDTSMT